MCGGGGDRSHQLVPVRASPRVAPAPSYQLALPSLEDACLPWAPYVRGPGSSGWHGGLFAFVSLVVGGSCRNSSPSVPPPRLQAVHPECREPGSSAASESPEEAGTQKGTGLPLPPVLSSKGHCEVNTGLHGRGGRGAGAEYWPDTCCRHTACQSGLSPKCLLQGLVPMEEEVLEATIRRWDRGEALLHRLSF